MALALRTSAAVPVFAVGTFSRRREKDTREAQTPILLLRSADVVGLVDERRNVVVQLLERVQVRVHHVA